MYGDASAADPTSSSMGVTPPPISDDHVAEAIALIRARQAVAAAAAARPPHLPPPASSHSNDMTPTRRSPLLPAGQTMGGVVGAATEEATTTMKRHSRQPSNNNNTNNKNFLMHVFASRSEVDTTPPVDSMESVVSDDPEENEPRTTYSAAAGFMTNPLEFVKREMRIATQSSATSLTPTSAATLSHQYHQHNINNNNKKPVGYSVTSIASDDSSETEEPVDEQTMRDVAMYLDQLSKAASVLVCDDHDEQDQDSVDSVQVVDTAMIQEVGIYLDRLHDKTMGVSQKDDSKREDEENDNDDEDDYFSVGSCLVDDTTMSRIDSVFQKIQMKENDATHMVATETEMVKEHEGTVDNEDDEDVSSSSSDSGSENMLDKVTLSSLAAYIDAVTMVPTWDPSPPVTPKTDFSPSSATPKMDFALSSAPSDEQEEDIASQPTVAVSMDQPKVSPQPAVVVPMDQPEVTVRTQPAAMSMDQPEGIPQRAAPMDEPEIIPQPTAVPMDEPEIIPDPAAVPMDEPEVSPQSAVLPMDEPEVIPQPAVVPMDEPEVILQPAMSVDQDEGIPEPTVFTDEHEVIPPPTLPMDQAQVIPQPVVVSTDQPEFCPQAAMSPSMTVNESSQMSYLSRDPRDDGSSSFVMPPGTIPFSRKVDLPVIERTPMPKASTIFDQLEAMGLPRGAHADPPAALTTNNAAHVDPPGPSPKGAIMNMNDAVMRLHESEAVAPSYSIESLESGAFIPPHLHNEDEYMGEEKKHESMSTEIDDEIFNFRSVSVSESAEDVIEEAGSVSFPPDTPLEQCRSGTSVASDLMDDAGVPVRHQLVSVREDEVDVNEIRGSLLTGRYDVIEADVILEDEGPDAGAEGHEVLDPLASYAVPTSPSVHSESDMSDFVDDAGVPVRQQLSVDASDVNEVRGSLLTARYDMVEANESAESIPDPDDDIMQLRMLESEDLPNSPSIQDDDFIPTSDLKNIESEDTIRAAGRTRMETLDPAIRSRARNLTSIISDDSSATGSMISPKSATVMAGGSLVKDSFEDENGGECVDDFNDATATRELIVDRYGLATEAADEAVFEASLGKGRDSVEEVAAVSTDVIVVDASTALATTEAEDAVCFGKEGESDDEIAIRTDAPVDASFAKMGTQSVEAIQANFSLKEEAVGTSVMMPTLPIEETGVQASVEDVTEGAPELSTQGVDEAEMNYSFEALLVNASVELSAETVDEADDDGKANASFEESAADEYVELATQTAEEGEVEVSLQEGGGGVQILETNLNGVVHEEEMVNGDREDFVEEFLRQGSISMSADALDGNPTVHKGNDQESIGDVIVRTDKYLAIASPTAWDKDKSENIGFLQRFYSLEMDADDADGASAANDAPATNDVVVADTYLPDMTVAPTQKECIMTMSEINSYFAIVEGEVEMMSDDMKHNVRFFQRLVAPLLTGAKPSAIECAQIRQAATRGGISIDIVDRLLDLVKNGEPTAVVAEDDASSSGDLEWDAKFDEMEDLNENEAIMAFLTRFGTLHKGGHFPDGNADAIREFMEPYEEAGETPVEIDAEYGFVTKEMAAQREEVRHGGNGASWDSIEKERMEAQSQIKTSVSTESNECHPDADGASSPANKSSRRRRGQKLVLNTAYDHEGDRNYIFDRRNKMATLAWEGHSKWLSPTAISKLSKPLTINGVAAAEHIHLFVYSKSLFKNHRPWRRLYGERTQSHDGYSKVDVYSILESTLVEPYETEEEYIPWEHREVRQRFLQETSVTFSRNWFGDLIQKRGNQKLKAPVCKPKSMEMPMELVPDPGEWTEEWYTQWKSPSVTRRSRRYSSSDDGSSSDGSYTRTVDTGADNRTYGTNTERGSFTEYGGSVADGSAFADNTDVGSDPWRPMSDHESRRDEHSFVSGADGELDGESVSSSDSSHGTTTVWEEAPECGVIINVRQRIGERVTRVHPDYTSSLRRSRWRKKYFPRGTFPY